ncbi:hypothetical protein E4U16_005341 [Claviceps sp. LM84 group G4]|nr:hypothetical protein E4U16_005341 [Claviceps sp. LM84 group G4]
MVLRSVRIQQGLLSYGFPFYPTVIKGWYEIMNDAHQPAARVASSAHNMPIPGIQRP